MRSRARLAVAVLLATSAIPICASGIDNKIPDMDAIVALESRANLAQPSEQCFLYAELVHQMTELSVRQYAAGDIGKATDLLKRIQQFAQKIHLSVAKNDKRIKNAEILLSHSAFRLNEMPHASSFEDRATVQDAWTDVQLAQSDSMFQAFKKQRGVAPSGAKAQSFSMEFMSGLKPVPFSWSRPTFKIKNRSPFDSDRGVASSSLRAGLSTCLPQDRETIPGPQAATFRMTRLVQAQICVDHR